MNFAKTLSRDEMRNIMAGGFQVPGLYDGCEDPCPGNCPILNCCCEGEHNTCPFKKCVSTNMECFEACNG